MRKRTVFFLVVSGVLGVLGLLTMIASWANPAVTISRLNPDPGDSDEASVSPDETVYIIQHMGDKLKKISLGFCTAGMLSSIAGLLSSFLSDREENSEE